MSNYLKYDEFVKRHCLEHAIMNGLRIGDKGYNMFGKSRPENGAILISKLNKLKNKKELSEFDKEYIKRIMNYNKGAEENMKNRDDYDAEAFGQSIFYEEATHSRFSFNIFEPQTVISSFNRLRRYWHEDDDKFDLMEKGLVPVADEEEEEEEEIPKPPIPEEIPKPPIIAESVAERNAILERTAKLERKAKLQRDRIAAKTEEEMIIYRRERAEAKAVSRATAKATFEALSPEDKIIFRQQEAEAKATKAETKALSLAYAKEAAAFNMDTPLTIEKDD